MKTFYITTAIDYANGSPHLGHAYEKVLTDVIARFRRLRGDAVYFVTGLDEHGQKVQQSAGKQGVEPQAYCDEIAVLFQALCKKLNISHDDYIRTTQTRHKDVVRVLLQRLYDKGEIYKADYKGFYSTRQEQFLTERDKVDGEWPEIYGEVVEITESNYFFKLSQYQDWLVEHIRANEDFILPRFRQKQVLEFLREPLNDLCISRPKERLSWGVPLPFDEDYVTYVWFDALTNYISAAGYGTEEFEKYWPADYHVIGKDILVPPHSVYWPIMLHASGIPLPKSLLVHGWWLTRGGKMSKSLGNIVDPMNMAEQFSADAFRYFLIREMNVGQDSDFSLELFLSRYTSDLGNDLGNLLSRLLNMGARYFDGTLPAAEVCETPESDLQAAWKETVEKVPGLFEEFQFHTGLDHTLGFVRQINRYAEVRQPWKLAKSDAPADKAALATSIHTMAEALRLATVLLTPVMPEVSARIMQSLGQPEVTLWEGNLEWDARVTGATLGEKIILFPRPPEPEKE